MTTIRRCYIQLIGSALLTLILANSILAQTTRFTYQGLLTDGGNPANGAYDLQFKLFSVLSGGAQQGTTVLLEDVPASNGIFKVTLDFGAPDFPGADRFLEISVRPGASTGTYTTLAPRQQLTSSPYAIRTLSAAAADSLSAACVNCVTSGQIASVAGSQVTGILPVTVVPAGSGNYIQNTTTPQAGSNFNISGDGVIGGNLGIGTNSLAHALQVNGVTSLGAPGGVYGFSVNAGSPGPYPSLGFNAFVNANASAYLAGTTGFGGLFQFQNGDGALYYSTSPSVAAGATRTFTSRLSILQNGNVGIGTIAPVAKLQVESSSHSIYGSSDSGDGVIGGSTSGYGLRGESVTSTGVYGSSTNSFGLRGISSSGTGVEAYSTSGNLVEGGNGTGRKFHITNNGIYVAGSDFAEALPVVDDRAGYEPGDVLIVSSKVPGQVEKASRPYDLRVAGIYSTRPGMLGAEKNGTSRVDAMDVPVAIVGIVPTKVTTRNGRLRVGDLLTTSSTPGYAMRCANRVKCTGAIVGKALEPLTQDKGIIKVLVMLR